MHTGSVLWDRGFASWLQFSLKGLGCSFVLLYPSSNDFTRTINFSFYPNTNTCSFSISFMWLT